MAATQQLAEPDSPTNQWLWYTDVVASSDTNAANASARRLAQKGLTAKDGVAVVFEEGAIGLFQRGGLKPPVKPPFKGGFKP